MLIGVPKEIKNHEYRIGLTPAVLAPLWNPDAHAAGERLMRITEVQRDRLHVHDGHAEQPFQAAGDAEHAPGARRRLPWR